MKKNFIIILTIINFNINGAQEGIKKYNTVNLNIEYWEYKAKTDLQAPDSDLEIFEVEHKSFVDKSLLISSEAHALDIAKKSLLIKNLTYSDIKIAKIENGYLVQVYKVN